MVRYNYNPIIYALDQDGAINSAAAKASIDLNKTFLAYRPRNRPVPDQIVAAMTVLDALLDKEIVVPTL